jgi:dienelactone hydrolase
MARQCFSGGKPKRFGVILVHTAAGPSDVFLHWKLEALAALGYEAFSADCFGDELGEAWEGAWNEAARAPFSSDRFALQRRINLAVDALIESSPSVDPNNIAAIGFCFGGMTVLDLARSGRDCVRSVVSFHGILDAAPIAPKTKMINTRILVLHGEDDPFVVPTGIAAFREQMRAAQAKLDFVCFGRVRHGFSNPGQATNRADAFDYDYDAATRGWAMALDFIASSFTREHTQCL